MQFSIVALGIFRRKLLLDLNGNSSKEENVLGRLHTVCNNDKIRWKIPNGCDHCVRRVLC